MLEIKRGIRRLRTAGACRAPRQGKRVDTKVSTLLTPTSFYFLVWRRLPTCDRCETGERQRIFSPVGEHSVLPCRDIFAVPDTVLLHMWFHLRKRGMTVPRNSLTRYTARHLRIRRLVQFIFVGAVYHNALTNCAALLCRACEDFPVCVAVRCL